MEEDWSFANHIRNFPRQKEVLCMWSKKQILHFHFVGQNLQGRTHELVSWSRPEADHSGSQELYKKDRKPVAVTWSEVKGHQGRGYLWPWMTFKHILAVLKLYHIFPTFPIPPWFSQDLFCTIEKKVWQIWKHTIIRFYSVQNVDN